MRQIFALACLGALGCGKAPIEVNITTTAPGAPRADATPLAEAEPSPSPSPSVSCSSGPGINLRASASSDASWTISSNASYTYALLAVPAQLNLTVPVAPPASAYLDIDGVICRYSMRNDVISGITLPLSSCSPSKTAGTEIQVNQLHTVSLYQYTGSGSVDAGIAERRCL